MAKMVDCENIRDLKIFDPDRELAPVLHGEWIATNKDERGYADTFACSVCDSIVQYAYQVKECDYEYCPHCGARMDLVVR